MKVNEYLEKVANKEMWNDSEVYVSKFDNSYITHVGMEKQIKFLADLEITEQLTHGVGFSPKENKWYGWSHRAIYGFTIGSTCKKGNVHYIASNLKEMEEDAIRFYQNEYYKNVRSEGVVEEGGDKYFQIKWEYTDDTPNKKVKGTTGGAKSYIGEFGRGEWTAKTMEDAKQMAIDFCRNIS